MARKEDLRVGMSVTFGNFGAEQTDGIIVGILKKNVKVRTVQGRKNAPAGAEWRVPPGLITIREDADFSESVRSDKEVAIDRIKNIMRGHNIKLIDLSEKA